MEREFRIVHVILDPWCKDQIAIGALTSEGFVARPGVVERVRGYCDGALESPRKELIKAVADWAWLVESVLKDLSTAEDLNMPSLSPCIAAGPVQTAPEFDTEVFGLKQFVLVAMFP